MANESITELIDKKIDELNTLCAANKIPFACLYAIEKGKHTETRGRVLTPTALNVKLTTDKITPLLAYEFTDNFKIVLLRKDEVYDEETFFPADAQF